jgi:transposase InsO family protein
VASAPNDIWAADYKGQFRLKNGQYCFPLTVSDLYSRFLLGCDVNAGFNFPLFADLIFPVSRLSQSKPTAPTRNRSFMR